MANRKQTGDRRSGKSSDVEAIARFEAYYRRGTELLLAGDAEAAIEPLLKARALDNTHVQAALNLSGAYILTRRFKMAVPILEQVAASEPENPAVWQNLGAAYLGNPVLALDEQQKKAIAAFERALGIDPGMPKVAYNIGLVYRDRRDYAAAAEWFGRAVRANPADPHARRLRAQMIALNERSGDDGGQREQDVFEEE